MEKIYLSDSGPKVSPAVYGFWRWENIGVSGAAEMERIINWFIGIKVFILQNIFADIRDLIFSNKNKIYFQFKGKIEEIGENLISSLCRRL